MYWFVAGLFFDVNVGCARSLLGGGGGGQMRQKKVIASEERTKITYADWSTVEQGEEDE